MSLLQLARWARPPASAEASGCRALLFGWEGLKQACRRQAARSVAQRSPQQPGRVRVCPSAGRLISISARPAGLARPNSRIVGSGCLKACRRPSSPAAHLGRQLPRLALSQLGPPGAALPVDGLHRRTRVFAQPGPSAPDFPVPQWPSVPGLLAPQLGSPALGRLPPQL